jgi:hypothetical protein
VAEAAGARIPVEEDDEKYDSSTEQAKLEQVIAAVRRVKLIEYLKEHLT